MSNTPEFSLDDVSIHNRKEDIFLVIHDKVYDCTPFVHQHPGGAEVLLDTAGQDSTASFEDVGHSGEAREILDRLYVGNLKRLSGDTGQTSSPSTDSAGHLPSPFTLVLYALAIGGSTIAYVAYRFPEYAAVVLKH